MSVPRQLSVNLLAKLGTLDLSVFEDPRKVRISQLFAQLEHELRESAGAGSRCARGVV